MPRDQTKNDVVELVDEQAGRGADPDPPGLDAEELGRGPRQRRRRRRPDRPAEPAPHETTYAFLGPTGHFLGDLQAENWVAWDLRIVDSHGREVATITRDWTGLDPAGFQRPDDYVVRIAESVARAAPHARRRLRAQPRGRGAGRTRGGSDAVRAQEALRAATFRVVAFLAAAFLVVVFLAVVFLAAAFLAVAFLAVAFLVAPSSAVGRPALLAGFVLGLVLVVLEELRAGLAAGRLGRVDGALQGGQQVDDLAGGLGRGRGLLDLAALDLGLDQRLDGLGVVVLELARASKSPARVSTSMLAIFTSAGLTSPVSTLKSGVRISSGHIIVCSTITSSLTRSTPTEVRCRSATVTTAIRSASSSAWRSRA